MTLDQIRIFIAVAERQHMTRAADALHLTQSTVSAAIRSLEVRHDVALFHRVGRGIELTETGAIFLNEARAVLSRAQAAEAALSELGGLKRGTLSVQASQTIASYWLPRHLVAFKATYPDIDVNLTIGNTADTAQAVLAGVADAGLVEGAVDHPALSRRTIAKDRLVIVVGQSHPWYSSPPKDPAALTDATWILREQGSGTRSEFELQLSLLGVDPGNLRVAFSLPSNEAVRAAVEAGAGATALSEFVVCGALKSGTLRKLPFDLPERCFQLLRHKERYASKALEALINLIKTTTAERAKAGHSSMATVREMASKAENASIRFYKAGEGAPRAEVLIGHDSA